MTKSEINNVANMFIGKITNNAVFDDTTLLYTVDVKDNTDSNEQELILDHLGLEYLIDQFGEGLRIELTPGKGYPIVFRKDSDKFEFLLSSLMRKSEPSAREVYSLDDNIYNAVLSNLTSVRPKAMVENSPYEFSLKLLVNAWENHDFEAIEKFIASKFNNHIEINWVKDNERVYIDSLDSDNITTGVVSLESFLALAEKINTKVKRTKQRQKFDIHFDDKGMIVNANFYASPNEIDNVPMEHALFHEVTLSSKDTGIIVYFNNGNCFDCTVDNLCTVASDEAVVPRDYQFNSPVKEVNKKDMSPASKKPTATKSLDANTVSTTKQPEEVKNSTKTKADVLSIVSMCDELTQSQKDEIFKILVS